jgi:hypothetical protein
MEQPPSNEQHELEPGLPELIPMLLSLEAQIQEQGWDQPPQVYALHTLDGDLIAVAPLMSPEAQASSGHPADFMDAITQQLQAPDAPAPPASGRSGFFGLVVAHEAWGRFDAAAATADPTRSLADQVGSVECRMLLLSTVQGTELLLRRIRGQEPVLMPPGQLVGQIPESMRALVAAISELDEPPE